MTSTSSWDDEYARITRAASQLRTTSHAALHAQPHPTARQHQIRSVQSGLARLKSQLNSMQSLGQINNVEAKRRHALIENLERQVGGGYTSQTDTDLLGLHPTSTSNTTTASSPYTTNTTFKATGSITQQALRHQDEMIDELANGVARLKHQTMQVNDEAMMQNRMLDDMDGDVENARIGLETETARALKLKEDQSVWRLYLIIAGLSVLLFLLITTGLG
jgi:hypothetical protein